MINQTSIGVKVGDVMNQNMVSIKPEETLDKCASKMIEKRAGILMVGENNKLNGVLTKKDIIWALTKNANFREIKAKDIMSRKVVTISPSRDIYDALVLMKEKKKRWLPVTDKGNVIGLITIKDILRIEPSLFDIAMQNMYIKEEKEKMQKLKVIDELEKEELLIKEGLCMECGAERILENMNGKLLCRQCGYTED
jgi:CBS domain-containing protein/ribosomal protein S27AE